MKYTAISLLSTLLYTGIGIRDVAAVDSVVDLSYTKLQGAAQEIGITQWLGVRFAAPPLGPLRFAAPQDPPSTTSLVDATKVGGEALPVSPYHRPC